MAEEHDRRALFEGRASRLFETILASGELRTDDQAVADAEGRAAFDLLMELGLIMPGADDDVYVAVDPATVSSRVVAPLTQQGADLIGEATEWARAFSQLAQTFRRAPGEHSGPFTEVRGSAIDPFLASVVADAEHEILTAQPQFGRNPASLETSRSRDLEALARGVTMRTLYQHAARRHAFTHDYVAALVSGGGEVRTLDEFFQRLIVVDRRLAVIPGQEDLAVAMIVREPAVVAYLADIFDRFWERARPLGTRSPELTGDMAAEQRAMTIRMLLAGYADQAAAKRLGVSTRTFANYIAQLKEEFEADTRFQLGYKLARAGISGDERPRDQG